MMHKRVGWLTCCRGLAVLFGLVFTLTVASSLLALDSRDATFRKTEQVYKDGDKSKNRDVALLFLDDKLVVQDRKGEKVFVTVPYASVTDFTYELSKSARIAEAVLLSPLFLLSAHKNHWLTVRYDDGGQPNFVLLKLDKSEYQQVLLTAEVKTGKKVERLLEK